MFFANDNILSCRVTLTKWQHIQALLGMYEVASGHCVNKQKTTIMFNSNTSVVIKDQIKVVAGISECSNLGTYLGLPSTIGKSKTVLLVLLKIGYGTKFSIGRTLIYHLREKGFAQGRGTGHTKLYYECVQTT